MKRPITSRAPAERPGRRRDPRSAGPTRAGYRAVDESLRPPLDARNETALERCDRNLAELLQEVRVAQTGVQVLFAFLLTVPFTNRFREITGGERALYFITLM